MSEFDRTKLTFEQAEGASPIPSQLALGELSKQLRSILWMVIHQLLEDNKSYAEFGYGDPYLSGNFEKILRDYWILHEFNFADEYNNKFEFWQDRLGKIFKTSEYTKVFGFLQFVLRHRLCPHNLKNVLNACLERGRAAYFISGDTIMPAATLEDGSVVKAALDAAHGAGHVGARTHLLRSGGLLSEGAWADSVRESIHAVESVAKKIAGEGATLSSALIVLQKQGRMNPNLKRAMNALYDYTSDEQGVRHALVLSEAEVSENDAIYMFSVCAAFVTYSIRTMQREL